MRMGWKQVIKNDDDNIEVELPKEGVTKMQLDLRWTIVGKF